MYAIAQRLQAEIDEIRNAGLWKDERIIESPQAARITVGGREVLNFCANNYLGLADNPRLIRAAQEGLGRWGFGMASVRFICGTQGIHRQLEAAIARFLGVEDAILYTSCFDANGGLFETLLDESDVVISDALNHASIIDGIRLCRAQRQRYAHADMTELERILEATRNARTRLIVTDGVFSMDGDLAPLEELLSLADEHDAWLMSDDAHGIGVLGGGHGSGFIGNTHIQIPLQMGTLSKATGSYGGYLCASGPVIELMRNRARTLIYSTGLPPASVAASIAALDMIEREPAYAALPVQKAKAFTRRAGLPEAQSPIVPVVMGDEEIALAASRFLENEGYLVIAIRPPTVPAGTARLRLTFTAQHPDDEIGRLADIVRDKLLA